VLSYFGQQIADKIVDANFVADVGPFVELDGSVRDGMRQKRFEMTQDMPAHLLRRRGKGRKRGVSPTVGANGPDRRAGHSHDAATTDTVLVPKN